MHTIGRLRGLCQMRHGGNGAGFASTSRFDGKGKLLAYSFISLTSLSIGVRVEEVDGMTSETGSHAREAQVLKEFFA